MNKCIFPSRLVWFLFNLLRKIKGVIMHIGHYTFHNFSLLLLPHEYILELLACCRCWCKVFYLFSALTVGLAVLDLGARSKVRSPHENTYRYNHISQARIATATRHTGITCVQYTSPLFYWRELPWPAGPKHLCPEQVVLGLSMFLVYFFRKSISLGWK